MKKALNLLLFLFLPVFLFGTDYNPYAYETYSGTEVSYRYENQAGQPAYDADTLDGYDSTWFLSTATAPTLYATIAGLTGISTHVYTLQTTIVGISTWVLDINNTQGLLQTATGQLQTDLATEISDRAQADLAIGLDTATIQGNLDTTNISTGTLLSKSSATATYLPKMGSSKTNSNTSYELYNSTLIFTGVGGAYGTLYKFLPNFDYFKMYVGGAEKPFILSGLYLQNNSSITFGNSNSQIYAKSSDEIIVSSTATIHGNLTVEGKLTGDGSGLTGVTASIDSVAAPSVILNWSIDGQVFTTTNTYTKGGFQAQIASTKTLELSNLYISVDTPGAYEWGIRISTGAIISGVMSWGTFIEQTVPVSISSYTWTVDKNIPANTPCKLNIISVPDGCTVGDVTLWGTNE